MGKQERRYRPLICEKSKPVPLKLFTPRLVKVCVAAAPRPRSEGSGRGCRRARDGGGGRGEQPQGSRVPEAGGLDRGSPLSAWSLGGSREAARRSRKEKD